MTIRQLIHSGPAKANELFAKLAETSDGAVRTRERLFSELKEELELLAGLEEKHLFPALRKHKEAKELVAGALADNKQVRALLSELERMPKGGEEFSGKVAELRKAFQQHVRDEKRELLPAVSQALSEEEAQVVVERIEAGRADVEQAKREEAERQRAEARREREEVERQKAEAEEAERQEAAKRRAEARHQREEAERQKAEAEEAERQEAARRRTEARREREEAERQKNEAEATERRARETGAALARSAASAAQGGLRVVEATSAAADAGAEIVSRGSRQVLDVARDAVQEAAASTSDAADRYQGVASAVLEAEGDLAGFWLQLVNEQVTHNVELFQKLTLSRDWSTAVEAQNAFVQASFERMNRLNSRYLETVQATMKAMASSAESQSKKAA
jgi:DNA repair exonuclease SbcCD ATPase subunit